MNKFHIGRPTFLIQCHIYLSGTVRRQIRNSVHVNIDLEIVLELFDKFLKLFVAAILKGDSPIQVLILQK